MSNVTKCSWKNQSRFSQDISMYCQESYRIFQESTLIPTTALIFTVECVATPCKNQSMIFTNYTIW